MTDETEAVVIRSNRCAATPVPHLPSRKLACDVCGRKVWVAKSLLAEVAESMPKATVKGRCLQCVGDGDTGCRMLPGQIEEMMAAGTPPPEIAMLMALTEICGPLTLDEAMEAVARGVGDMPERFRQAYGRAAVEVAKVLRRN